MVTVCQAQILQPQPQALPNSQDERFQPNHRPVPIKSKNRLSVPLFNVPASLSRKHGGGYAHGGVIQWMSKAEYVSTDP